MPNRIIKETICTSPNLNTLSQLEENFFYRLIVNCDDYGKLDARPTILRAKCFPLRLDQIKDKDIASCLQKLAEAKLLFIYKVDGQCYLQMLTWEKHQQMRAKRSKYPDYDSNCNQLIANDSICNQLLSNVTVIQSNPIQSEKKASTKVVPIKEFDNVTMTETDYQKLITSFGEEGTKSKIENLSFYKRSKGKVYKDDYATIMTWERNNTKKSQQPAPTHPIYERVN